MRHRGLMGALNAYPGGIISNKPRNQTIALPITRRLIVQEQKAHSTDAQ